MTTLASKYHEETADKVNLMLSGNHAFSRFCAENGIPNTRRQARKYLQGRGQAFRANKAGLRLRDNETTRGTK